MTNYMSMAVAKAQEGKTPFGAVIVREGKVLAAVYNTVRQSMDPSAHAEINAIRQACQLTKSTRLEHAILYTTGEPCPMCMAAVIYAGISKVVYGADIPLISQYLPQISLRAHEVVQHSSGQVTLEQLKGSQMYQELLEKYA